MYLNVIKLHFLTHKDEGSTSFAAAGSDYPINAAS